MNLYLLCCSEHARCLLLRAAEELARSQALAADLERMRVSFAQAQKEIADLRNSGQARDAEFASLRSTLERFQRENGELKFK